ncbi:MAG TPA: hypothetical protein VFG65_03125 [Fimbriimonadales bacterium]|nr:hypothetical protein [Fimbriimonadales bacterium]
MKRRIDLEKVLKVETRGVRRDGDTAYGFRRPLHFDTSKLGEAGHLGGQLQQLTQETLDSRHTYTVHAQLHLNGAGIFNAKTKLILIACHEGLNGVAGIEFNAPAAGEHYLITFFVDVISDDTTLKLFTFGDSPDQTLQLNSGQHEIPVIAIPSLAGDQSVQLCIQMEDHGFYLNKIEIEKL